MADILIVEDDKSINELIRRTVRMTGHRGLPVHDGREALKAVDQKVPDLILGECENGQTVYIARMLRNNRFQLHIIPHQREI